MSRDAILLRMQAAGVPPYSFKQSLKQLGEKNPETLALSRSIASKGYRNGVAGFVSYDIHGKRGVLTAATLAKELVLNGENVRCLSVQILAAEFAKQDWFGGEPEPPAYWVIPDFYGTLPLLAPAARSTVQAFLLSHLGKGGGLVLGGGPTEEGAEGSWLSEEFVLALSIFEHVSAS